MKQVFIRLPNPNSVEDIVSLIRKKISEANSIIDDLRKMRNSEDLEITTWHQELNKVEQDVINLEQNLTEMGE